MQIRKATIDDAPAVFALRREAILAQCVGPYPKADMEIWTAGTLSASFAQRIADHFHVVVADGQIVASGMIDLASGKIDAVFVRPAYMGRGVGRAVMRHLEGMANAAGLRQLQLESTLNAAPFYRALGFEGDGRKVYESSLGVSLTCVPMVKHLHEGE